MASSATAVGSVDVDRVARDGLARCRRCPARRRPTRDARVGQQRDDERVLARTRTRRRGPSRAASLGGPQAARGAWPPPRRSPRRAGTGPSRSSSVGDVARRHDVQPAHVDERQQPARTCRPRPGRSSARSPAPAALYGVSDSRVARSRTSSTHQKTPAPRTSPMIGCAAAIASSAGLDHRRADRCWRSRPCPRRSSR